VVGQLSFLKGNDDARILDTFKFFSPVGIQSGKLGLASFG
jgi:hypothetical protein